MDAITFTMRALPQPVQPGPAPSARGRASADDVDETSTFRPSAPKHKPTPPKDKPVADKDPPQAKETNGSDSSDPGTAEPDGEATKADKSTAPGKTTEPADKGKANKPAATDSADDVDAQRVASGANDAALLTIQNAAIPASATTTPVAAPAAPPPEPGTATSAQEPDATMAIQATSGQTRRTNAAQSPSVPAPAPSAQDATQAAAKSPATPPQPAAELAAPAAPTAPGGNGTTPSLSHALNSLLSGATAQGASQPATTAASPPSISPNGSSPTDQPTTPQPASPQLAQITQLSAAAPTNATPPSSDKIKTELDAAPPAHHAADATGTPAVSFGTDPGATAHVKTATAAYETARAAMPLVPASEQVAMQIHRAIEDGVDKMTVELKPASLGRVSAEIQFQSDHRVHVVLSADRPATLDALRNDSRALERALQDAGLRADAGSLSFRFDNSGGQQGFTPDGGSTPRAVTASPAVVEAAPHNLAAYTATARPGGIDLRV